MGMWSSCWGWWCSGHFRARILGYCWIWGCVCFGKSSLWGLYSTLFIISSKFPSARHWVAQKAPRHHTTPSMLPKHSAGIQATEFSSFFLRPENLFCHLAPDRMSHACFFFLLFFSCLCHNTIKARLMDCCSDACLCGRFSHVCKNSEALSSWSPCLSRSLLPGESVWPDGQLLNVLLPSHFRKLLKTLNVLALSPYPISQPLCLGGLWMCDVFALTCSVNCVTLHWRMCGIPKTLTHHKIKNSNISINSKSTHLNGITVKLFCRKGEASVQLWWSSAL